MLNTTMGFIQDYLFSPLLKSDPIEEWSRSSCPERAILLQKYIADERIPTDLIVEFVRGESYRCSIDECSISSTLIEEEVAFQSWTQHDWTRHLIEIITDTTAGRVVEILNQTIRMIAQGKFKDEEEIAANHIKLKIMFIANICAEYSSEHSLSCLTLLGQHHFNINNATGCEVEAFSVKIRACTYQIDLYSRKTSVEKRLPIVGGVVRNTDDFVRLYALLWKQNPGFMDAVSLSSAGAYTEGRESGRDYDYHLRLPLFYCLKRLSVYPELDAIMNNISEEVFSRKEMAHNFGLDKIFSEFGLSRMVLGYFLPF